MMRPLDSDEQAAARAAFSQVFTGTTCMRSPFQSSVEARMLLWSTEMLVLDVDQFRSLFAAARAVGDSEVYIATYIFNWEERNAFEDWLVLDLADEDSYHGDWPVEVPLGACAVLTGGPLGRAEARQRRGLRRWTAWLHRRDPPATRRRRGRDGGYWLGYWEDTRRPDFEPDWIPDLLEHLYGHQQAHAWLAGRSFAR